MTCMEGCEISSHMPRLVLVDAMNLKAHRAAASRTLLHDAPAATNDDSLREFDSVHRCVTILDLLIIIKITRTS